MSLQILAFRQASWLALFKFSSQALSWATTILIARLLLPEDYALVAMATVITGYAEIFGTLGLGASIIQKEKVAQGELSSVFWFGMGVSLAFAIACVPFSYITASFFSEPSIIPLTQAVGLMFIFSGLQIVPGNLLRKEIKFKQLGKIDMGVAITSCCGMLIIAWLGGGVWALIGGILIRGFARTVLLYWQVEWRPTFYFKYKEVKPFINFGVMVALSTSFFYIFEVSDRIFAGRVWTLEMLGFYLLALQLAQIPTEKIVVLINQISYPVLSKLQADRVEFESFYLNVSRITATIVFPIFVGGALTGDLLIRVVLDDKWLPIIFLFQALCVIQIVHSLNAINGFVHMARGKPHITLLFDITIAATMAVSYYFAVPKGLHAILVPWFTTYLIIVLLWIAFTLRIQRISIVSYLKAMFVPAFSVAAMALMTFGFRFIIRDFGVPDFVKLGLVVLFSGVSYLGVTILLDKRIVSNLRSFIKPKVLN